MSGDGLAARGVAVRALARGVAVAFMPTLLVGAVFVFYTPGVVAYANTLVVGAAIAGVIASCAAVELLVPRRRPRDDVVAAVGCVLVGGLAALAIGVQLDYTGAVLGGHAGPLDAAATSIATSWRGATLGAVAGGLLGVGAYQRRRGHSQPAVLGGSALAAFGAIVTLFVLDTRPPAGQIVELLAVAAVPGLVTGGYLAGVIAMVDDVVGAPRDPAT